MPAEIYLVKVGMTMTEGIVEQWYIEDGARVEAGEPIYSLETEKVNMDVEAEQSGIVKHVVEAGTTLEPGDVVGWIFSEDEEIPDELPKPKANLNIAVVNESSPSSPQKTKVEAKPQRKSKRIATSPAARRKAKELGVDMSDLQGTGPGGRITIEDVENAHKGPKRAQSVQATETQSLSHMRQVIGKRMFSSLQSTAQLTISMEVAMDDAIRMRASLNEEWGSEGVRLTYTDLVAKACTEALLSHTNLNSYFQDDALEIHSSVNLGIAVAVDDGLLVPIIQNADSKTLQEISKEASRLADAARANSLSIDEVTGGTFTITSLGMYGVDVFTPILNPPQSGILGIGRIYEGVSWQGEVPTKTNSMVLSLTWDHRVLDGAPAAEFLSEIKQLLESPHRLIL